MRERRHLLRSSDLLTIHRRFLNSRSASSRTAAARARSHLFTSRGLTGCKDGVAQVQVAADFVKKRRAGSQSCIGGARHVAVPAVSKASKREVMSLTSAGAIGGGFWGMLIGLIFLNLLLGAAVGAGRSPRSSRGSARASPSGCGQRGKSPRGPIVSPSLPPTGRAW